MIQTDQAINYMKHLAKKGIRYSMEGSRTGQDGTADCSGAIYGALRQAGMKSAGFVPSTETLHDLLVKEGYKLIAFNKEWEAEKGDIVIFGIKGRSAGAGGHVVLFLDHDYVIHCNSLANGVSIDKETSLPYSMGYYVYRQEGSRGKARGCEKPLKRDASPARGCEKPSERNARPAVGGEKTLKRKVDPATSSEKPLPRNVRRATGQLRIARHATHWLTREAILPAVLGQVYDYDAVADCQVSVSKRAFRLKKGEVYLGWLLEQDAELLGKSK